MSEKIPHISMPLASLLLRVLNVTKDAFESWPENVQKLFHDIAAELFLVRYNPFINPEDVRVSVNKRLEQALPSISEPYPEILTEGVESFWHAYKDDMEFRDEVGRRLKEVLPEDAVISAPNKLVECSTDATDLRMELPIFVLAPRNTKEVQTIIRLANELGFHVVPRGGGSGLTGGAVPALSRSVILSMARMKEILSVDEENLVLCAQAGVITIDAIQAAADKNLLLTVDPASKTASSLGGNISENAGGPFAFEYGTTLDNILSYKMVMPNGDLIEVKRRAHPWHKILPFETAIFDIFNEESQLIDSVSLVGEQIRGKDLGKDVTNKTLNGLPGVQKEGVDGVITETCFILHPQLKFSRVLCLEFFGRSMHSAVLVIKDVVSLRDKIRDEGDLVKISALEEFGTKYVQAIEYVKKSSTYEGEPISVLIMQLDSDDEEALDTAVQTVVDIAYPYENVDIFVAKDAREAEFFWEDRHKLSAISKRTSGFKINEDIVIPIEGVPQFSDFLEDLNLHYAAKAYRRALQRASQLAGVSPKDELIATELSFTASTINGEVSSKELSDQELEVQSTFFFGDLKSRYPRLTPQLDAIYEEMLNTRIVIANHMHAGDGNCHVNFPVNSNDPDMMAEAMEAADKVFLKVMSLNGAITGEHGIGITKISYQSREKIKKLREYKNKVDPKGILNPGKLTTRNLPVEPYTFSFNRLIQDLKRTALPEKERLIRLLTNIQICTRCGKCKQVCPMYHPAKGMMFHPRNKNLTLGALIEAIYYSQAVHGKPDPALLAHLARIMEHCTTCGRCVQVCPVKIQSQTVALEARSFLGEKGASGHPIKDLIMNWVADKPQKRVPMFAKGAAWGQFAQNRSVGFIPAKWRKRFESPFLRSPGPIMPFRQLGEILDLNKGSIFDPPEKGLLSESVIYFPGCGASVFNSQIGLAALHLLLRAKVTVVMPPRHLCCGYPLRVSGAEKAYNTNREKTEEELRKLLVTAGELGIRPRYILTSCGTCRETLSEYELEGLSADNLQYMDVIQFILERLPKEENSAELKTPAPRILYHRSCHSEWSGLKPTEGEEAYRSALATLTGCRVDLSPGCCGESGLGAMTSPKIYNILRETKKHILEKELENASQDMPIVVGCPSCKIGIKRALIEMDDPKRPVLHGVEFLAENLDGNKWKKILKKTVTEGARKETLKVNV